MYFLIVLAAFIIGLVALGVYVIISGSGANAPERRLKREYAFSAKRFFMTRAEHECFDAILAAVGEQYHVFPQVHLSAILDHKTVGQDWRAAFSKINGKSVDFVLCDKAYISPKLVIELDDKTHGRPDRIQRDIDVENILKQAGIPILRIRNSGRFDTQMLVDQIRAQFASNSPK